MSNPVVRVTKKENVVVDGVKYKAKTARSARLDDTCAYCALRNRSDSCAPCEAPDRKDGRNVYFIVKPPKAAKPAEIPAPEGWIAVKGIVPALNPGMRVEWVNRAGTRSSCSVGNLHWCIGSIYEVTHYRPVT